MLPKVAIVRVSEAEKMPLPQYVDGVGTSMLLRAATSQAIKIAPQHFEVIRTGIAIALPLGMEAQVRSLKESTTTGILVINAPVTIDASDRKEIKVCLYNVSQESVIINQGDPIALLVFTPVLRIEWMDMTQGIVRTILEKQTQERQTEGKIEKLQTYDEEETSDFVQETKSIETQEEKQHLLEEKVVIQDAPEDTQKQTENASLIETDDKASSEAIFSADTIITTKAPEEDGSKMEEFEPIEATEESIPEPPTLPVIETPSEEDATLSSEQTEQENFQPEEVSVPDIVTEKQTTEGQEPIAETPAVPEEVNIPDIIMEQQTTEEQEAIIEPPAILAEFEKLENDFYKNLPDSPGIPDILQQPNEEKKDDV